MSLRQSMYTGLAQPEVKTNGRSWKNSTAFTSSSILAVVSAMNAWSAKCMSGANFNRLEFPYLALRGERACGEGSRGEEKARGGRCPPGSRPPQQRPARHLHQRAGHRRSPLARSCRQPEGGQGRRAAHRGDQEAPGEL